ncbi:pentapeptide repeat-containing protein [Sinorhizobium fredii]|uniref:pentapeptide repeat-containing protein n=1 Tax=Rhizobium fredii TaxID=380 RepID=UPI00138B185C|nr:pentapeptide repeat-containing protein [Sinorhizobium fredii]
MKRLKRAASHIWSRIKHQFEEPAIRVPFVVFVVGVALVALLYAVIPSWRDGFFPGVFIEFNGMLLDVIVFGIIAAWFLRRAERQQQRQRQQEVIDDYKKWDTEEGKLRIAGAARRLVRLGTTSIDFGGLETSDFSFARYDIRNIRGSTFYDGSWGLSGSRERVKLTRVDFYSVDCRDVVFSKFNPLSAFSVEFVSISDCTFIYADLRNAVFNGAHLTWTQDHPEDLVIWHDEIDDGPPMFEQTHYSPFHNANLAGASFANTTFKNADFREAIDILECDFAGAKGLETCIFDNEQIKEAVQERSKSPPPEGKRGLVASGGRQG